MIKLILSDVDGTLIPLGEGRASERTRRAIAQFQEGPLRFGLATGRDVGELRRLFGDESAVWRTGILSNGKKIMVDGELVRLTLLDGAGLRRVADLLSECRDAFLAVFPYEADAGDHVFCVGAHESDLPKWEQRYSFSGIVTSHVPDVEVIGSAIGSSVSQEQFEKILQRLSDACPMFDFVQPGPNWCDILPKGLNKGSALPLLMDELGIASEEIVMFGDADNDLSILLALPNSVVVAGATPAARAAAKWQIGPAEDESVAEILEEFALTSRHGGLPAFMQG